MASARLLALQSRRQDELTDGYDVAELDQLPIDAICLANHARLDIQVGNLLKGLFHALVIPDNARCLPHDVLNPTSLGLDPCVGSPAQSPRWAAPSLGHSVDVPDAHERVTIQTGRAADVIPVLDSGGHGPRAENKALKEGVRGEAIGTVETTARDLSASEKAWDVGLAVETSLHPATQVMLRRKNGNWFRRDIDPNGPTVGRNVREVAEDRVLRHVGNVQEHVIRARMEHFRLNSPGHDISWREFLPWVDALHEPALAVGRKQHATLAAHRL
mmetsp:Transcript_12631/g.36171  ORF Transcript_12631/g.36171 Transcript_12631/m.36171 type:complete len:273 (-) Transcript_12631:5006-5824(-)